MEHKVQTQVTVNRHDHKLRVHYSTSTVKKVNFQQLPRTVRTARQLHRRDHRKHRHEPKAASKVQIIGQSNFIVQRQAGGAPKRAPADLHRFRRGPEVQPLQKNNTKIRMRWNGNPELARALHQRQQGASVQFVG